MKSITAAGPFENFCEVLRKPLAADRRRHGRGPTYNAYDEAVEAIEYRKEYLSVQIIPSLAM
jgi:hypothetical protein